MKTLHQIYKWMHTASYLKSLFLLITRLFWGISFFIAGFSKFQDMQKFKTLLVSFDIYQPTFNAFFVASMETLCGLLLAIGFMARLASLPLIAILCTAYATVHQEAIKFIFTEPSKLMGSSPFTFLFACLLILIFGPGKLAIDYLLAKDRA
ncbi:MAG: DoxX family protein [Parachlamydiaceae bacterium]